MTLIVDSFFKPDDQKNSLSPDSQKSVSLSHETITLQRKIDDQVHSIQQMWQQYETQQTAPRHQTIQKQCDELQNLLDLVPFTSVQFDDDKMVELHNFITACRLQLEINDPIEETSSLPKISELKPISVSGKGNNCAIHSALVSLGYDPSSAETIAPIVRGNVAVRMQSELHKELETHWERVADYSADYFPRLGMQHDGSITKARAIIDAHCRAIATQPIMFDHTTLHFLAQELNCRLLIVDPKKSESDLLHFGPTEATKTAVIFYDQRNLHYSALVQPNR